VETVDGFEELLEEICQLARLELTRARVRAAVLSEEVILLPARLFREASEHLEGCCVTCWAPRPKGARLKEVSERPLYTCPRYACAYLWDQARQAATEEQAYVRALEASPDPVLMNAVFTNVG
jgi:hypothetical protein